MLKMKKQGVISISGSMVYKIHWLWTKKKNGGRNIFLIIESSLQSGKMKDLCRAPKQNEIKKPWKGFIPKGFFRTLENLNFHLDDHMGSDISQSLKVLPFTSRPLIYLKSTSVCAVTKESSFIFLYIVIQFPQNHLSIFPIPSNLQYYVYFKLNS